MGSELYSANQLCPQGRSGRPVWGLSPWDLCPSISMAAVALRCLVTVSCMLRTVAVYGRVSLIRADASSPVTGDQAGHGCGLAVTLTPFPSFFGASSALGASCKLQPPLERSSLGTLHLASRWFSCSNQHERLSPR